MAMATTDNIMAATATITAAGNRRIGKAGWLALLLAGSVGLGLVAFAAPRLAASIVALPARPVLWDAYAGRPVPLPELLKASEILQNAVDLGDHAAAGDRGFLLLRAAAIAPLADQFRLLMAAEAATEAGLAGAPGNPSHWLRLAALREGRGDRDAALVAWRMSVLTGGFEPSIMADRLRMGARLLPLMDGDSRSLLKRQIRSSWTLSWQLPEMVRNVPGMEPLVDEALDSLTEREMADHLRNNGGPPPPRPPRS